MVSPTVEHQLQGQAFRVSCGRAYQGCQFSVGRAQPPKYCREYPLHSVLLSRSRYCLGPRNTLCGLRLLYPSTRVLRWRQLRDKFTPWIQVRRNKHVEVLPLSTGCLGACTYCKTKHARGELGSYALSELVARFKDSVQVPRFTSFASPGNCIPRFILQDVLHRCEAGSVMGSCGWNDHVLPVP